MKFSKLFLKKPMKAAFDEVTDEPHGLKRHLKAGHLIAIGIGAIIGAGIFVITGQAAAAYAGPSIVLSFLVAAFVCMLAGLCYAELSSLIPISGGSYSYSYFAMGEFPAWIVGWSVTAQYLVSASTVAVGWSGYFASLLKDFGLPLGNLLTSAPFTYSAESGWHLSGSIVNVPAMILVFLVGILIAIGIRAAAHFNNAMVVTKLATIALFIVLGIPYIQSDNWIPFLPENTGVFGEFGWSGMLRAAGLLFFAYLGFDTVSSLAQDAINPQKNLPKGILGSLFVCTVAYIITALVLTGVANYTTLGVPDPMSVALNIMGAKYFWLKFVVKLAIIAGLASVVLVQLLGQTRIFFAMGKDGLLPSSFCQISKTTRTPIFSTIATTLISMTVSGLFSVAVLGQLVSITTLFVFCMVCLGVLILRYTHPEYKRSFKVPFVPYVPLIGAVACAGQMCFLPLETWMQLLAWLGLGLIVYFSYGFRNSKLQRGKQ